jgi:hypothetical protein
MRLVSLAGTLLLVLAVSAFCQDYAAFVAGGDRTDNPLVLEMLRSADLSTAITIAGALGRREDRYVADILVRLLADAVGQRDLTRELLLRVVLASAFAPDLPDLRERLDVNRPGLEYLSTQAAGVSPALQREILRVLALSPEAADPAVLMEWGMSLAERLGRQGGRLEAEQAALLRAYLEAVGALGDPDFAPVALLILERTREASVARAARKTARQLLSARPPL